MKRFLTVATILTVFAGSALAEEKKIDPKTHFWAKFGVGSWTKLKTRQVMEMPNMKSETISETTYTLIEVTDQKAVVEMETVTTMINAGQEMKMPAQKTKMDYPFTYEVPATATEPPPDAPKPETGTEEIELAGKKLKCTWTKMVMEQSGMKTTSKSWSCEDVPGWSVKTESNTEGATKMTMTIELVGFEAK